MFSYHEGGINFVTSLRIHICGPELQEHVQDKDDVNSERNVMEVFGCFVNLNLEKAKVVNYGASRALLLAYFRSETNEER